MQEEKGCRRERGGRRESGKAGGRSPFGVLESNESPGLGARE